MKGSVDYQLANGGECVIDKDRIISSRVSG